MGRSIGEWSGRMSSEVGPGRYGRLGVSIRCKIVHERMEKVTSRPIIICVIAPNNFIAVY